MVFHWSTRSHVAFLYVVILPVLYQGASRKPAMVLVHGIVQGGYFFDYKQPELAAPTGVKGIFEDAGYEVFNPSLPYHNGPSDAYTVSDGPVTADDYANSLAAVFTDNDLQNTSVVCHSAGGLWCQILYSKVPERIARVVYLDAFVALPGNSFVSTLTQDLEADPVRVTLLLDPAAFFYPLFYTRALGMAEWMGHFINTRRMDMAFVKATYSLLVPEPSEPLMDVLNVTAFVTADLPKAFVLEAEDFVSGATQPDPRIFRLSSDRLAAMRNGGYEYKVFSTPADHQGFLTGPTKSAQVILEAVRYLGG